MGFFSALGALGKIAGALKSIVNWFREGRLIELGRDKERAIIASEGAKTNEKSKKARATVRNGDDARRLRRERYENRNNK